MIEVVLRSDDDDDEDNDDNDKQSHYREQRHCNKQYNPVYTTKLARRMLVVSNTFDIASIRPARRALVNFVV